MLMGRRSWWADLSQEQRDQQAERRAITIAISDVTIVP